MRRRSFLRLKVLRLSAAVVALTVSGSAHADVSSWLFAGTGPSWVKSRGETEQQLSLKLDTGMGTPPSDTIIVGGLFRVETHFGRGTDVGLALRTATHGFVNGQWGGALDLGGYQRWWGAESTGGVVSLVGGAPWGITLVLSAGRGSNEAEHYAATLGVDLARLTVYRRSGEQWWKNPFPAYRPDEAR